MINLHNMIPMIKSGRNLARPNGGCTIHQQANADGQCQDQHDLKDATAPRGGQSTGEQCWNEEEALQDEDDNQLPSCA